MRWQTVLKKLNEIYERAKNASYVEKPMAYALYKTWLEVDKFERKKNRDRKRRRDSSTAGKPSAQNDRKVV